ncbi:thioredoxin family protein [Marinilactibacillus piezotolerans]|uniref:thioredoxin family protein n=1 Tax=Marinilactibacillus piezotolerans TaxID=258723 RepID=UPI0009B0A705|nr:thioredoxin family protein [Marinilactibacillus piezotolerans]
MTTFPKAQTIEEIRTFIASNPLAFLYISRENCGVCHVVRPQVEEMLEDFPTIRTLQVSADEVPEVAGEFTVFTVPALLLFIEGKEMIREARFIVMDDLREKFQLAADMYEQSLF